MDKELSNFSSPDGIIYVCTTCHRELKGNRCPAQAKVNGMELDEIPEDLRELNGLELSLICRRIPFIRLIKLPKGKQKGIKGAAVNVPADLGTTCHLLPYNQLEVKKEKLIFMTLLDQKR